MNNIPDEDVSYKLNRFVLPVAIHPSKTADTRSADKLVTKAELLESSEQHIADVNRVMQMFTSALSLQGQYHDWTKLQYIDLFYSDFNKAQKEKVDFTKLQWYKMHITKERHHLMNNVPEDVNLFDVLERIADITTAGIGRSGWFDIEKELTFDPELLKKAYINTIKWALNKIKLVKVE